MLGEPTIKSADVKAHSYYFTKATLFSALWEGTIFQGLTVDLFPLIYHYFQAKQRPILQPSPEHATSMIESYNASPDHNKRFLEREFFNANGTLRPRDELSALTFVHFACCNTLTDEALLLVCTLPKVTGLSLFGCSGITDLGVRHISDYLVLLEELSLSCVFNLSDTGVGYLSQLTQLKDLDIGVCREVTETGYLTLTHLTNLTGLHLSEIENSDPPDITDTVLVAFSTSLLSLTELDICHCSKITDIGLKPICENLKKLSILRISGCVHVTKECGALELPELETFDVDGCSDEVISLQLQITARGN